MAKIEDVALQAGVSQSTVSFVLNDRAQEMRISPQTIQKVLQAAKKLGFQKNYHALSLSTGKSNTVGVVTDYDFNNRMWGAVFWGIEKAVRERGKNTLIIQSREGVASESAIQFLETRRIDELVVVGSRLKLDRKKLGRLPIVQIEGASTDFPALRHDPAIGIAEGVEHLLQLGHQHILWLGKALQGRPMAPERVAAFQETLKSRGLSGSECYIPCEVEYFENVEDQLEYNSKHLADVEIPARTTAIMCYNDTLALALYALLQKQGRRIPDDISIIGFDDLFAPLAIPGMTSISHMFQEMGRKAVELVMSISESGKPLPKGDVTVPTKLIIRKSTAQPAR